LVSRVVPGELDELGFAVGVKVAASIAWEILKTNGIGSSGRRAGLAWPQLLRSQAEAILASDFFTVNLRDGAQACVLAVIEHATRRIGHAAHDAGARHAGGLALSSPTARARNLPRAVTKSVI
jgi:hypothetical protein